MAKLRAILEEGNGAVLQEAMGVRGVGQKPLGKSGNGKDYIENLIRI